jgi:DNA anti-recombination protein RmuC
MDAVMLDFLVRTGIPAGLGVVVVIYLLRSIIPEMQKTFRDEMAATRKTFEDSLRAEQATHQTLMKQVTDTLSSEGAQTRATLQSLDQSTRQLSQNVYKLYGHSMTAFETNSVPPDGKRGA